MKRKIINSGFAFCLLIFAVATFLIPTCAANSEPLVTTISISSILEESVSSLRNSEVLGKAECDCRNVVNSRYINAFSRINLNRFCYVNSSQHPVEDPVYHDQITWFGPNKQKSGLYFDEGLCVGYVTS